jgi:predicted RNA polymerase sigma factor
MSLSSARRLSRRATFPRPTSTGWIAKWMAIAESEGPERGLAAVTAIEGVQRLARYPFYPAAVAELELRLGRPLVARTYFARAKDLARNEVERRFLERRLDECARLSTS